MSLKTSLIVVNFFSANSMTFINYVLVGKEMTRYLSLDSLVSSREVLNSRADTSFIFPLAQIWRETALTSPRQSSKSYYGFSGSENWFDSTRFSSPSFAIRALIPTIDLTESVAVMESRSVELQKRCQIEDKKNRYYWTELIITQSRVWIVSAFCFFD